MGCPRRRKCCRFAALATRSQPNRAIAARSVVTSAAQCPGQPDLQRAVSKVVSEAFCCAMSVERYVSPLSSVDEDGHQANALSSIFWRLHKRRAHQVFAVVRETTSAQKPVERLSTFLPHEAADRRQEVTVVSSPGSTSLQECCDAYHRQRAPSGASSI